MGTIQENVQDQGVGAERSSGLPSVAARTRHSLQPKGSCWYCDKPVDAVRRFCGKECADAFDDEAAFTADASANPAP